MPKEKTAAAKGRELMARIKAMPTDQALHTMFYVDDNRRLFWNIDTPPFRVKGAEVKKEWHYINGLAQSKQEIIAHIKDGAAFVNSADRFISYDDMAAFERRQRAKQEQADQAQAAKPQPAKKSRKKAAAEIAPDLADLMREIQELKAQVALLLTRIP